MCQSIDVEIEPFQQPIEKRVNRCKVRDQVKIEDKKLEQQYNCGQQSYEVPNQQKVLLASCGENNSSVLLLKVHSDDSKTIKSYSSENNAMIHAFQFAS